MGTVFNFRESTVEQILMGPPNNTYKGFQDWLETKHVNGVLKLQQLEAISNEEMSPTSGSAAAEYAASQNTPIRFSTVPG